MYNQVPWETIQGGNAHVPQNPPHTRSRALSTVPYHPALFPAQRPSTVHTPDLFFVAPNPNPPPSNPRPPIPPARPPPIRYSRPTTAPSGPHPPAYQPYTNHHAFQRSYTCPPPIPPKPSQLQPIQTDAKSVSPISTKPPPELPSEEDELALALEISRSESKKQQPVISQEDEDLARALQESLNLVQTNSALTSHLHISVSPREGRSADISSINSSEEAKTPVQSSSTVPVPSPQTPTSSSTRLTLGSNDDGKVNGGLAPELDTVSTPIGRSFIDFDSSSDHCADDEVLARTLADADSDTVSPAINPCANDEVLARQLAQEDGSASASSVDNDVAQMRRKDTSSLLKGQSRSTSVSVTGNEDYARLVTIRGPDASLRGRSKSAMATLTTTHMSDIQDLPPPYEDSNSTPTDISSTAPTVSGHPPSPHEPPATEYGTSLNHQPPPRVNSSPILNIPQSSFGTSSQQLTPSPTVTSPQSNLNSSSQYSHLAARNTLASDPAEDFDYDDASSSSATSSVSNPYISDDLLNGVSIGFEPPPISSQLGTWNKALPTVISLPHGRSVPLHIQAPSWRHVLKLLARLPGTTIQPTIEAMAETKTEHKLRTVVQFVKPHLASTEWRVILWFTLEHPVPSNITGSARYINDVNVLPWSYTFSQPPQLLRGGPDSQLAKVYTIPATSPLPFPKLPISCPDLAMYLHAAMEVSRRHMNDSSSGVRKLAKMIDVCYPNTNTDEPNDTERRGVGNLFKRVMGRTNNRRRGGNEDTYDLVTPFVADEWG